MLLLRSFTNFWQLRKGGPQAVLTEIERIHSDGSKRVYLEQLFSQATLKPSDLKDASRLIRSISSDGDKAQVIITLDANYFATDLRSYLFDAAESIHSDGDKRRVLSHIVKKEGGSLETRFEKSVLRIVRNFIRLHGNESKSRSRLTQS